MALDRINLGRDSSGRPLVLDERTYAKYKEACRRLGFALTIVQGSYRGNSGAAASAGTHDRGGVIDLRTWDLPASVSVSRAVRVLRECGLIAWYRTQAQGFDPHIHAIDRGNPELSSSAASQVVSWQNGRNGLASNGPDDGPRVTIPFDPPLPPQTKRYDAVKGAADRVKRAKQTARRQGDTADARTLKRLEQRLRETFRKLRRR